MVHMQRHEDSFTFRPYLQRDLAPFLFFTYECGLLTPKTVNRNIYELSHPRAPLLFSLLLYFYAMIAFGHPSAGFYPSNHFNQSQPI